MKRQFLIHTVWLSMIENYFVMLVTHLKSLVGNIVGMTHAILKIETNVKKSKLTVSNFI
jgi:hypothetical protein